MATYGPWRQDPDYELVDSATREGASGALSFGDYDIGAANAEVRQNDAYYVITTNDLREAVAAAYGVHSGNVATDTGVTHYFHYGLEFPSRVSTWGAAVARNSWYIQRNPDGFGYYPPDYAVMDPMAIGIEYEGTPFDPARPYPLGRGVEVGVALSPHMSIDTRVNDSTSASGDLTAGWTTQVHLVVDDVDLPVAAIPGRIASTGGSIITEDFGRTVDLTPLLVGSDWAGAFYTHTPTFVPPADMSGTAIVTQGTVFYGSAISRLEVLWKLRPPRYRFVYALDETVGYRRNYPRDDSLAGGAGRNFPRPRSIQSSNRIGGGYL